MIRNQNGQLAVYAVCHCLMDFACCFLLMKLRVDALLWIVGYHGLAFAMQPVIGAIVDRSPLLPHGVFGFGLVIIAYIIARWQPIAAVLLAGVGNALFHLEGGYVSMHRLDHKLAPLGIFVAPGALGIALGTVLGMSRLPFRLTGLAVLLPSLLVLVLTPLTLRMRERVNHYGVNRAGGMILILTFISIIIRSYAGFIVPIPELSKDARIIAAAFSAMIGKAMGGYLADHFGSRRTALISQFAAPVLLLSSFLPVGLISVVLINLPMAVTLASLSDEMPEHTGIAFGMAPLGLYFGYVLSMMIVLPEGMAMWVCMGLMILCGILLSRVLEKQ